MNIYLDIETLPTTDQVIIDKFAEGITAPGQYKKPDSIAEWMAANKDQALKDLVSKTSFDGLYGHVACIAWEIEDGDVISTSAGQSESETINMFYEAIAGYERQITVVGHNVAGFDLPFLKHRSIILGIKPPGNIRRAMAAKPWGEEIADTMLMWSSDREKRVSMDKLCYTLGIPGKDDFDGSMVAETWFKDPQKVIDYCRDDVSRTRAIYKKLSFT